MDQLCDESLSLLKRGLRDFFVRRHLQLIGDGEFYTRGFTDEPWPRWFFTHQLTPGEKARSVATTLADRIRLQLGEDDERWIGKYSHVYIEMTVGSEESRDDLTVELCII